MNLKFTNTTKGNQSKTTNGKITSYFVNSIEISIIMASSVPSKVYIQVESAAEQQENMKNSRKVFNNLQKVGSIAGGTVDKENLVGRSPAYIGKEALIKKTSFNW